jgi:hypothetical protein
MAIRPKNDIVTNINTDLADNNAGLISAADVRENMKDIVESITTIVSSGNFDSETPFTGSNLRVAKNLNDQFGELIVEAGITFANGFNTDTQIMAYPGPGGISHNDLDDLDQGNVHTQYMHVNGWNKMVGNLPMGDKWINSSGNVDLLGTMNDRGFQFEYVDGSNETIHVGNKSTIEFDKDNSKMSTGKGVAQAWINFNGSGNMAINSSYNIEKLQRTGSPGKFKVFFKFNTFADANYVAIGNSNSRGDSDSAEDFEVNTVGIVDRQPEYVTFYVLNDAGQYVDAAVNDLVIFGNASGVIGDTTPTIEIL